jgi:hypothetical protein
VQLYRQIWPPDPEEEIRTLQMDLMLGMVDLLYGPAAVDTVLDLMEFGQVNGIAAAWARLREMDWDYPSEN